jgi:hypothetical protein
MPPKLKSILFYVWLALNLAVILVSAQTAYRKALNTEEFAYACDSFGYLRMAAEIRDSVSHRRLPDFRLESNQTRLLIDFMKAKNVPVPTWEELVAPHAHHYFPVSDHVGVQYPPGTGLTLAAFPEGTALYRLNKITIAVILLVGLAAIALAGWKKAWASIALVSLAIYLMFTILGRMGQLSFSINATFAPLLLTCLLVLIAASLKTTRYRLAWWATLTAGLLLGYCTMIRLPAVLLAPAFLILLWPNTWRIRLNSLPVIFCLAIGAVGILPILVNQQHVAGAWYLSTYASVDAAAPTFSSVKSNLSYFFGFDGPATEDNWALIVALIGFAAFVLIRPRVNRSDESKTLSWKRLAVAAFIAWLLSAIFFLTHTVTGAHYMIVPIVATVVLLGFGSLIIEVTQKRISSFADEPRIVAALVLIGVMFPGVAIARGTLITRAPVKAPAGPLAHPRITLPAELADEKAWIWADLLTGSLWYYAHKPAFKIQFTDAPAREMLFKFVFDRGEQQYLIQDSAQMQVYMDEIQKLGGTLEQRGKVDGQLYFLVHWPPGGPAAKDRSLVK